MIIIIIKNKTYFCGSFGSLFFFFFCTFGFFGITGALITGLFGESPPPLPYGSGDGLFSVFV